MSRRRQSVVVGSLATVAAAVIVLPLVSLVARAPWTRMGTVASSAEVQDAVVLTLWTSVVTTAIALVLGVPLAIHLAEAPTRGRRLLRAATTLPIVLPPAAGGIALLAAFGRKGPGGRLLDELFGYSLLGTPTAVILAQLFVALPFLVVGVDSALQSRDRRLDEAAALLGATPTRALWLVTLPGIRGAIVAGATLTWARAVGELGATLAFAGSFPGRTRTVPSSILLLLETDPDAARALAVLLLVVAGAILLGLRDRWAGLPGYWSSSATSRDR